MRRYALLLSAIGVALVGCTPVAPSTEPVPITYAVPLTIAAAPAFVAADQGYWSKAGLDVNLEMYNSGREALDVLLAGSAQVMSVSETPPLRAVLGGQDIRWIATVTNHREAKLTVRTDRIGDDFDLAGHRIGTVAGTNSDYYLSRWLEAKGLTTNDVDVVALDPPSLVQAFVQGDIDAMFAWEPYNYNASSKMDGVAVSVPTTLYEGRHSIIMNTEFASTHLEESRILLEGFQLAEAFIADHPQEARKIVAKATGVAEDVIDKLWDEYDFELGLDDGLLSILQDEAKWIVGSEGGEVPNLAKYIDPDPLMAVDPNLVDSTYR